MNHSTSEILANLLVNSGKAVFDQSLATSLKWPLFILVVPDQPVNLLTVYDTLGMKDGRVVGNVLQNNIVTEIRKTIEHPGWQVMVRSIQPASGFYIADMISDFFDTVLNNSVTILQKTVDGVVVPTTSYKVVGLFKTSPIMNSGQDEKRRFLFTLNGTTTITQL